MQRETTYSGILGEWQRLEASLAEHTDEVPHLEGSYTLFSGIVGQVQDLARQQAELTAEKQRLSQELKLAFGDGQRLATILRQGLKQYYGIRSEKLVAFGLQPYRGRTGRKEPIPPPVETPAPTADTE